MTKKISRDGRPQFTTYSNLAKSATQTKRGAKKVQKSRARAEYLATLPKNPVKRFFYHLKPSRVFKYWFSKRGALTVLKIIGVGFLVGVIGIGGMLLYFRKQLDSIDLANLEKNVKTTVSYYYDKKGKMLWQDVGSGNYRLVVPSDQISDDMKHATVAIEDKAFYSESGVSFTGLARAFFNNLGGGSTQGASTLTQQLIKQVYFANEAGDRGLLGIPRKMKEFILAVEADKIYSKDQILTMYLNESPYGGRRNGVESAAQTYFGLDAKDLGGSPTGLAEAALLASIPQSPTQYNPYMVIELCSGANATENGCSLTDNSLVRRQRTTLNYMAQQGYITSAQADEAKKIDILSLVKPQETQGQSGTAPQFLHMVQQELTQKLGAKVVGQGGLKVTTTLDVRVQSVLENEMNQLFNGKYAKYPKSWGTDDASMVMENNHAQILGLMGSRGYDYPGYGNVNMATSFVQPGSSIKPLVYASLINNQNNPNGSFGAGSIIEDDPIPQSIYTTSDGKSVANDDGKFHGSVPIRKSLANSYNIPAIKAMHMNGVAKTQSDIRAAGNEAYCTDGADQQAGLASAIGGCGTIQVEHTAAFATLANGGLANPYSTILKVENAQGQVLYQWKPANKQVFDPQTAYIVSDILSDPNARTPTFSKCPTGECVNGVKTATKTGTSNIGNSSKDIWMMSYSPVAALSVWAGNHTPTALRGKTDGVSLGFLIQDINSQVYKNIFQKDGDYTPNQWFPKPAGIQEIKGDIFPSWYNKTKATQEVQMTFDRVSKKLATTCTPDAARITETVTRMTDPTTKKTTYLAPDGYTASARDNVHVCGAAQPNFGTAGPYFSATGSGGTYTISLLNVNRGDDSRPITSVSMTIDGQTYNNVQQDSNGIWSVQISGKPGSTVSISATALDSEYYGATISDKVGLK